MVNKIQELENQYEVSKISWNGINLWPIFKTKLHAYSLSAERNLKGASYIKQIFSNLSFGIKNLIRLKKFKYLVFSNSNRRILSNEEYHERVVGTFLNIFPNSLLIENPIPNGHYSRIPKDESVLSESIFFIIQFVLINFFKITRKSFRGEELILQISKQLGIENNGKGIFYRFLGQYYTMKLFLCFFKPKASFFVCSYVYYGYILALKEKNIPTIEFQHGTIGTQHVGYNYTTSIGNDLFPNYLLTFGTGVQSFITGGFKNIDGFVTVGYSYLDKIKKEKSSSNLKSFFPGHMDRKIVLYTGNIIYEEQPIEMLISLAKALPKFYFVYLPRDRNAKYSIESCENFTFYSGEEDTYELIKQCDIHSTIYSTCALEALALGKVNVLLNINNLSKKYLGNILESNSFTYFVDNIEEFQVTLENLSTSNFDENQIMKSVDFEYSSKSHEKSLKEMLIKLNIS